MTHRSTAPRLSSIESKPLPSPSPSPHPSDEALFGKATTSHAIYSQPDRGGTDASSAGVATNANVPNADMQDASGSTDATAKAKAAASGIGGSGGSVDRAARAASAEAKKGGESGQALKGHNPDKIRGEQMSTSTESTAASSDPKDASKVKTDAKANAGAPASMAGGASGVGDDGGSGGVGGGSMGIRGSRGQVALDGTLTCHIMLAYNPAVWDGDSLLDNTPEKNAVNWGGALSQVLTVSQRASKPTQARPSPHSSPLEPAKLNTNPPNPPNLRLSGALSWAVQVRQALPARAHVLSPRLALRGP